MTVSERDRDYFRRLGEWKAASHAEALREHLAKTPLERIEASIDLWRRFSNHPRSDLRIDDPTPFYDRARQLGFYKP